MMDPTVHEDPGEMIHADAAFLDGNEEVVLDGVGDLVNVNGSNLVDDIEDDSDDDDDDDDSDDSEEEELDPSALSSEEEQQRAANANANPDGTHSISHLIDIREPLFSLRSSLEQRLNMNLSRFDFWLQDKELLPPESSLVEQCMQQSGVVQINLEVGGNKINIVDVLKPPDESMGDEAEITLEEMEQQLQLQQQQHQQLEQLQQQQQLNEAVDSYDDLDGGSHPVLGDELLNVGGQEILATSVSNHQKLLDFAAASAMAPSMPPYSTASAPPADDSEDQKEDVGHWTVSSEFRKEQERLNIPNDPEQWSKHHVKYWISFATKQFPRASIDIDDWNISGKELCSLTHEEFRQRVLIDPQDLMWTHLELLRRSKYVTVAEEEPVVGGVNIGVGMGMGIGVAGAGVGTTAGAAKAKPASDAAATADARKTNRKPPVRLGAHKFSVMSESALGNRTGNNGQVQLWQFLLELLTEFKHCNVIHWIGQDGEFKLENPEEVAKLWGVKKNKPNMNYEKLSRALRYYYDGDMISKVHGKRFVYKFVCDLKDLLGYSAAELSRLVSEAKLKSDQKAIVY